MQLSDVVLLESKTARNAQLVNLSHETSSEVLNKVKGLMFALWEGTGRATTEQIAEFYEIPVQTVKSAVKDHRDEFESDGLKVLRSINLKEVSSLFNLSPNTPNLTLWTPRAALRLGFLLRDSLVAKQVRSTVLDILEAIPAAQPSIHFEQRQATVEEIESVFAIIDGVGIDPNLFRSAKLSAIAKSIPHLAKSAEEAKRLISNQMQMPEQLVSPTELGNLLAAKTGAAKAPSGQAVNKMLLDAGLQVPSGKKNPAWELTEAGKPYGQLVLETAKGHSKTLSVVRWFPSVLNVLTSQNIC